MRNLKDTLVSLYFQVTRREFVYSGTVSDFLKHDQLGVMKAITFYNQWLYSMDVPRELKLISYEQMHSDTQGVLSQALDFIGVGNIDKDQVIKAVKKCEFENMKRVELAHAGLRGPLAPGDPDDAESFKVRKGKVGNYRQYLSSEDIDYIDNAIESMGCSLLKEMNAQY